ncbi:MULTISPECIES: M16 family metallopeptidase [Dictyoglomus]|uniref:Peptidase M16 domain protein n=1 Tax=Dictyoglomus turgidum (strain DSM 6724 / Z-1310) TaxID=515635 RepID=B8E2S6_DICTD|nr:MULTISPECIES: pitrilysin family protein [Dictyoglomus]ACK42426.1 peptidase M16 domain protein [Dictyoglomus turgidum DSM 6724]HBU32118.1 insulinase family protein [Dictyoglomus sp.]
MNISEIELKNGLKIIHDYILSRKTINIIVAIKVGSRHEEKIEHGLAHFVEHLLFKNNSGRGIDEIRKEIDRLGGELDAFTTKETTYFTLKILSYHFVSGVKLLSDIILRPRFSEEEINLEKSVVREEIRMYKDSPEELVFDNFFKASWDSHPLVREILGTEKSVSNFNKDLVISFYNKHYKLNNMIIGISGDVPSKRIEEVLDFYFTQNTSSKFLISSAQKPPKYRPKSVFLKRNFEQVQILWGTEGYVPGDPNRESLALLSVSLGGGISSRLFRELREKRGLVYSVETHILSFKDASLFGIYTATAPQTVVETFKTLAQEKEKLIKEGLSKEELDLAKRQTINSILMAIESPSQRLFYLIDSYITYGKIVPWTDKIKKIRKVTLEDINSTIKDIFSKPFAMSVVGPINSQHKEILKGEV